MSEKVAYRWLRDKVALPGDRLDRLENLVAEGMPDVNGCFMGSEFWIEIKSPTEPKRASTPLFGSNHKVSQEQANWMLRQIKAKGRAHFLIVTDFRRILIDGKYADDVNNFTVAQIITRSMWCAALRTDTTDRERLRNALIAGF